MYQAVNNRIIVKPDKINSDTGGLIDTSLEKAKILTGTVVSVGEQCAGWKEGDRVIYARHSGMEMPDGTLNMADMDVFAKIIEDKTN